MTSGPITSQPPYHPSSRGISASLGVLALAAILATVPTTTATAATPFTGSPATLAIAPATAVAVDTPGVVSATTPAAKTPHVLSLPTGGNDAGDVRAIGEVGAQMVLGGKFAQVAQTPTGTPVDRTSLFAFDKASGTINAGFAPVLATSGGAVPQVESILAGPTAGTVYVGGSFNTVNGVVSRNLALINLSDGSLVAAFKPKSINAAVKDMALVNGHLVIGGWFVKVGTTARNGLASLNPATGALDNWLTIPLTDPNFPAGAPAGTSFGAENFDVNAAGSRMIVIGSFRSAGGLARDSIAMVDLTGAAPVVRADWDTQGFLRGCNANNCRTAHAGRDVAFDPTGSYFVVVSRFGNTRNFDAAVRFETSASGTDIPETWRSDTVVDSFYSVAVTKDAVYVGGHFRWVNVQSRAASDWSGAVPRPGIAALDPGNGTPLSWNPGRNPRGLGALALTVTSDGLYVGSDTDWIGAHQYRRSKIAFFPYAGGSMPQTSQTRSHLPADLTVAGIPGVGVDSGKVTRVTDGNGINGVRAQQIHPGDDFNGVTGAWMVGNTLWAATNGSTLLKSTYNPGTQVYSPWSTIDPYNDAFWSNVQTGSGGFADGTYRGLTPLLLKNTATIGLGGIFFDNGYLYYTYNGRGQLFRSAFNPDSGAIGPEKTVSGVSMPTDMVEMTAADGVLFYTRTSTGGDLYSAPWTNTGSSQSINFGAGKKIAGGADGTSWNNNSHGMWLVPTS